MRILFLALISFFAFSDNPMKCMKKFMQVIYIAV